MSEPTMQELAADFKRDLADLRALVLVLAREQEELRDAIYTERRERLVASVTTPVFENCFGCGKPVVEDREGVVYDFIGGQRHTCPVPEPQSLRA